jgi:hypothetical protein
MLRKSIFVTLVVLLTTEAAFAQLSGAHHTRRGNSPPSNPQQKELDKAYRSAVEKIPVPKKNSDPWGDIRSDPPSAAKNKQ